MVHSFQSREKEKKEERERARERKREGLTQKEVAKKHRLLCLVSLPTKQKQKEK